MPELLSTNFRFRKSFSRLDTVIDIPNLIEIQNASYNKFLQKDVAPEERETVGLQAVFKSVFPIKDVEETCSLEFVRYTLDRPKYDISECRQRGMTYAAPIRVVIRLVIWDIDETSGAKGIRDIKEQEIYFGEIPLMTETGTFIVNGTERVIVSQLHRSPGVFFDHDKGKSRVSGKVIYSGHVIPYRGSWLDFEFDQKDLLFVRIDRRRKFPATILLRALGLSEEELIHFFYKAEHVKVKNNKLFKVVDPELLPGQMNYVDIMHPRKKEVLIKKNKKFTKFSCKRLVNAKISEIETKAEGLVGTYAYSDILDSITGEVIVSCNELITEEKISAILSAGVAEFDLLYIDNLNISSSLRDTLLMDKVSTPEEAMLEIYKKMRPGDPPTKEMAETFFQNLFFNPERYDLSRVGRLKINHKFNFDVNLDCTVLRREDILEIVKHLIDLRNGRKEVDDIDHLGNRRVKSVGELVENQYRVGLVRMERAIKERMSLQDVDSLMPHEIVNPKPVTAVIKEFFGSSQLSQFMDQTNPIAEITHKRRLSALGPGGMTRERAGFEVRDVHPTHYGRVCPVETPEGPNIGLISSLSSFARVNEYGFIETPYRKVEGGVVQEDVKYYSALEEEDRVIAPANAPIGKDGKIDAERISARKNGEYLYTDKETVELMDVSPNQLVSIAASLIPFLENDDANRALMGSNMQRQAVPLLKAKSPLIGTGIERKVAQDSGVAVVARRKGIVDRVDATRIVVKAVDSGNVTGPEVDIYNLIKYQRSNQNTCINQRPIINVGDKIEKGDIIADGPATEKGELALGQNILVAFMPWGGYNFEDSILVSESLVVDDTFTSIHIEEFECVARDTKLGREEITRDIPNVSEEALADLDESGIIRIGAEVKPGDILIGKVTPKGETQLSPEEKLLRAIFGEKAGDFRDTSLRVSPGVYGTVLDAQIFAREGVEKDERAKEIEEQEVQKLLQDQEDEIKIIRDSGYARIMSLLVGHQSNAKIFDEEGNVFIDKNEKLTKSKLAEIDPEDLTQISIVDGEAVEAKIETILHNINEQSELVRSVFEDKIEKLKKGDELPPGVIKMVKVFIAVKRRLSVGDKMAGRHGNKGVISRILPVEDMPFMEDGTPVEIVLNPLGVPSRMNVGQIFETHLGWAALGLGRQVKELINQNCTADALRKFLKRCYGDSHLNKLIDEASDKAIFEFAKTHHKDGVHIATPVFDGATEADVVEYLKLAKLPESGQSKLRDGRTGEWIEQEVTVGVMYMLKLNHLVSDKIHARSIGPYSLVTQQPLGGKAQFGGQRLGEMEVWALEAYGAAYCLQEFLTVKSDDIHGRTKIYEAIVKGQTDVDIGLPESFKVLIKELSSLGLNMELMKNGEPLDQERR